MYVCQLQGANVAEEHTIWRLLVSSSKAKTTLEFIGVATSFTTLVNRKPRQSRAPFPQSMGSIRNGGQLPNRCLFLPMLFPPASHDESSRRSCHEIPWPTLVPNASFRDEETRLWLLTKHPIRIFTCLDNRKHQIPSFACADQTSPAALRACHTSLSFCFPHVFMMGVCVVD